MTFTKLPKHISLAFFMACTLFQAHNGFGQEGENLKVLDHWIGWSDSKDMLVHHLNRQAFDLLDVRDQKLASLKTKSDWIKRQQEVGDILRKVVGTFPEKTPLDANVTDVVKKDGYRIEKVVFQSMPGFYVTGALYIPDGRKGKTPAILFTSGHTMEAFRYDSYQTLILNLVKKGFIVFGIDPLGQGERIQSYDKEKNASALGGMTREHSYLGNQCLIAGTTVARYFIWDGIRAIDYLLSRREVDPSRLGITGQSGGGTQAAYIFAFDKRIKAGAPVNFITGFRRLLESIGPQDGEQNFYHGIASGTTHADLLEVRAPNPVLICAGTRDFFSIQGARETYAEVKNGYGAFNASDEVGFVEDDWGHGLTPVLREGIYAFFQKHLDLPGNPKDEKVTVLKPEELRVTRTGQVATSFDNPETVFTINKKETEKLIDRLEQSRKDMRSHLTEVASKAKILSGYQSPTEGEKPVFRGRYQRDGYAVEMYALHGEGDYVIPLLLFIPSEGSRFSSVIYLHPNGKSADAAIGGKIEELVRKGYVVAAPDLIGTGETQGTDGSNVAMLIGRSITGVQAGDISRVVNFLKSRQEVDASKISAVAFGEMGPVLVHAAAFDKSIHGVSLVGSPLSYKSMATNEFYDMSFFDNAVAGALTAYDLSDLIACIAPRRVALVELQDQMAKPASAAAVREELLFPNAVYSSENASGNIRILQATDGLSALVAWGNE